ncbi:MAG: SUMF1/EgtB/PvdO family nonheme iron enzyme [Cyanobacteria bacterium P01_G01_bin.39]
MSGYVTCKPNKFKLILPIAIAFFNWGCQADQSANSSDITRPKCEADDSFVYIPGGKFILGSDLPERDFAYRISAKTISNTASGITQAEQKLRNTGWFDRENTKQTATLDSFCLSRNLVTNQEYQEFINATNHRTPGITEAEYRQQGFLVHPYSKVKDFLWATGTYPPDTSQHPVVLVSYDDALAYAEWKGKQTGETYRLPTALEWEKAARGESGNYFPWGNNWQDDATNAAVSGLDYTSAIASFPVSKSIYGVEDMAGNVFEYTSTLQKQNTRAIMKGCSWDDLPGFCRGAYQHTRPIDSRHILFGFRLVKEP